MYFSVVLPSGEFSEWRAEMDAFAKEAQERARALDGDAYAYVRRALFLYFNAGGVNDEAQEEVLRKMVSASVRLGHGFAGVEQVLGIASTHVDPRVYESMAQMCSPGNTGVPFHESRVLSICTDIGHFIAKIPAEERVMTNEIIRAEGTDQGRAVSAQLRASDI